MHNHKTKYTHSQEWVYFVLNVLLGVEPTKKLVNEKKRKTVIAFILVPQVKMPKLINFAGESEKWQAKVPTLILENWKDK